VTVPERPCKPDRDTIAAAYLPAGPNIQYADNWSTIQASSTKRDEGLGTPTLIAAGDQIQSSWLMVSTDITAIKDTTTEEIAAKAEAIKYT